MAPGGLERYFTEVHDLAVAGQLTDARQRELRLRYDTEEPDAIPPGHWAAPSEHETCTCKHEIGHDYDSSHSRAPSMKAAKAM